ncbi:MAG: response regulator [bacterium]
MKVLVAEDDKVMSKMMCGILQEGGHTAIPAYDAMQATMYAIKQSPDVVLLDINMPGGTGMGVLTKLKASSRTSTIPVIVVSGSTDPAVPKQVEALGAARFLAKPIDPDALLTAVADVMK